MIISKKFERLLKSLSEIDDMNAKNLFAQSIYKQYTRNPDLTKTTKEIVEDIILNYYFGNMQRDVLFPITNFLIQEKIDMVDTLKLNDNKDILLPIEEILNINNLSYNTDIRSIWLDMTKIMYNADYNGINTKIDANGFVNMLFYKDSSDLNSFDYISAVQKIFVTTLSIYAEYLEDITEVYLLQQILQWIHNIASKPYKNIMSNRVCMNSIKNFFTSLSVIISICRDSKTYNSEILKKQCSLSPILN